MTSGDWPPRLARVEDADEVAQLLHDFNVEFATPTPGPTVLADRLRTLLGGDDTFAILAGAPSVAVALITLRPSVWYQGPVALLDELYVVPHLRDRGIGSSIIELLVSTCRGRSAEVIEINVDEGDVDTQRFYVRHGFNQIDPDTGERAFYFFQELTG